MFFPMSWMSPCTVARTTVPISVWPTLAFWISGFSRANAFFIAWAESMSWGRK